MDACNPGVTVCIRERVVADVATTFVWNSALANVDVTKILVGVPYIPFARCEYSPKEIS